VKREHRCPGCRAVDVPNTRLSCLACWRLLPAPIQQEVRATAHYPLLHPRRASILEEAVDFWREVATSPPRL
jgi:hypothetical protein